MSSIVRTTEVVLLAPRVDVTAEAIQWGPTWGQMKQGFAWLASRGIPYKFPHEQMYKAADDDTEYGLPTLYLVSPRWDLIPVRVGHHIVWHGKGFFDGRSYVEVLDPQEYAHRFDTDEPLAVFPIGAE